MTMHTTMECTLIKGISAIIHETLTRHIYNDPRHAVAIETQVKFQVITSNHLT